MTNLDIVVMYCNLYVQSSIFSGFKVILISSNRLVMVIYAGRLGALHLQLRVFLQYLQPAPTQQDHRDMVMADMAIAALDMGSIETGCMGIQATIKRLPAPLSITVPPTKT